MKLFEEEELKEIVDNGNSLLNFLEDMVIEYRLPYHGCTWLSGYVIHNEEKYSVNLSSSYSSDPDLSSIYKLEIDNNKFELSHLEYIYLTNYLLKNEAVKWWKNRSETQTWYQRLLNL